MFQLDGNILIETHSSRTINHQLLDTACAAGRTDLTGSDRDQNAPNLTQYRIACLRGEIWKLVKQIFPSLTPSWLGQSDHPIELVQSHAGQNTILAHLIAVLFGAFMYFHILLDVLLAPIYCKLGIAPSLLLAYLITEQVLSLQRILVAGKIMGRGKTIIYILPGTVLATLSGYIFSPVLAAV